MTDYSQPAMIVGSLWRMPMPTISISAVTSVTALADYRLLLGFANGDQRVFDVRPYLDSGVFAALKDVSHMA